MDDMSCDRQESNLEHRDIQWRVVRVYLNNPTVERMTSLPQTKPGSHISSNNATVLAIYSRRRPIPI